MRLLCILQSIQLLQLSFIGYQHAFPLSNNSCLDSGGAAVCPIDNTCCTLLDQDGMSFTGCIPFSKATPGHGECCKDHVPMRSKTFLTTYGTGCSTGTRCASSIGYNNTPLYYCEDVIDGKEHDSITHKHPRYILTPSSSTILGTMYGFPVNLNHPNDRNDSIKPFVAYYSNFGSILSFSNETMQHIRVVLFVIHGSSRNADDYMNVGMTLAHLQTTFPLNEILVLAPRFLAPKDPIQVQLYDPWSPQYSLSLIEPMRWDDLKPVEHTWRYGANALPPSSHLTSFDVMDSFIRHFTTDENYGRLAYPNLELIIVMGHSAGGQYTQRWALLSDVQGWKSPPASPHIRVLVANPRSFAYLDARRYINDTFQIPPESMISKCIGYNQWEWGLEPGGTLLSSYKDRILATFTSSFIADRYATRDVIYLSGSEDTETLHGSCEDDDFQGLYRRQRSSLFFKGLKAYFRNKRFTHYRKTINGVGHDHALMFESDIAANASFGDIPSVSSFENSSFAAEK